MILAVWLAFAFAGPMDDARLAIEAHNRGRDVAPLVQAIQAVRAAQVQGALPKDAPTYEMVASAAFLVASDGPEKGRADYVDIGISALELAVDAPGARGELALLPTSYALLATRELRQAPQHADWPSWIARGKRILAVAAKNPDPGGAALRGQLADQIARYPEQSAREAAPFVLVALAADQTSAPRVEGTVEALLAEGAPDAAADLAIRGVARYPTSKMNALAGAATLRSGKPATAVPYLEAAQKGELVASVQVQVARDLALAYVKLQQREKAVPALVAAIALDPQAANLHYELGRIHALRGTEAYNAAPGDDEAKRQAAKAHFSAAIPHLQAALADPRYEPHARAALTVCQAQVAPPTP